MPISQRLTAEVRSARDAVAVAEPFVRREVESAQACSVVVYAEAEPVTIAMLDVGFVAHRPRLFGGPRLWQGFVTIDNHARQIELRGGGEFGAEQIAQLSAVPGGGFPPEPLDVASIVMDVADVLRLAAARLAQQGALFRGDAYAQLLLRKLGARHEWSLTHESQSGFGSYVLVVDACSREITYERLSRGGGEPLPHPR